MGLLTDQFRDFDRVTGPSKEQMFDRLGRIIEEKVYQSADHADTSRQDKVESFLTEAEFFADAECALPMFAHILVRTGC